jgi:hypothetical protein
MEAPPPSPGDYVDMGPVSPNHYLRLQDHSEEEEPTFFMDAVSTLSIPAACTLLFLYPYKQPLFQLYIGKIFRRGRR